MAKKFVRRSELVKKVGMSYSTIYRLERAGVFPVRRQLSPGAVGWLLSEVETWMDERDPACV